MPGSNCRLKLDRAVGADVSRTPPMYRPSLYPDDKAKTALLAIFNENSYRINN